MRRGYIIWIADKGRELHLLRLGESEGKIFQFPRAKFFLTSPTASSCRRTSPDWHIFFFPRNQLYDLLRFDSRDQSSISSTISPILMNLSTRVSDCFVQFQSVRRAMIYSNRFITKVVNKVSLWKSKVHTKVYVCRLNECASLRNFLLTRTDSKRSTTFSLIQTVRIIQESFRILKKKKERLSSILLFPSKKEKIIES